METGSGKSKKKGVRQVKGFLQRYKRDGGGLDYSDNSGDEVEKFKTCFDVIVSWPF